MQQGLGDVIIEASIELEEFFYKKCPELYLKNDGSGEERKLTLGDERFDAEVRRLVGAKVGRLYNEFVRIRNSIVHYGGKNFREHEKIRGDIKKRDIEKAKSALLNLLRIIKGGTPIEEGKIVEILKDSLTPKIFQRVFPEQAGAETRSGPHNGDSASRNPDSGDNRRRVQSHIERKNEDMRPAQTRVEKNPESDLLSSYERAKKNALDLFEGVGHAEAVRKSSSTKAVNDKKPNQTKQEKSSSEVLDLLGDIEAANPVEKSTTPKAPPAGNPKQIRIRLPISLKELSRALNLKPFQVIKHYMDLGIFANASTVLDSDLVAKICEIHGCGVEPISED